MKKLKIYGERNTGTRFLERLIRENLRVRLLPGSLPNWFNWLILHNERVKDLVFKLTFSRWLGWKHTLVPEPDSLRETVAHGVLFLCLTKHPYSWLLSLYRRPYHSRQTISSFEEFLQTPWPTVGRENATTFSSPVEMWNRKNKAYLRLSEHYDVLLVPYEELLHNPLILLERLTNTHGLSPRTQRPRIPESSTKERGKSFQDYRDYYLQEQWRDELRPSHLALIDKQLDWELVERLGYSL